MATTGCNVSLRPPISRQTLSRVLTGEEAPARWAAHLRVFFSEQPVEVIAGTARQLGCSLVHLQHLYETCGAASPETDEHFGIVRARA